MRENTASVRAPSERNLSALMKQIPSSMRNDKDNNAEPNRELSAPVGGDASGKTTWAATVPKKVSIPAFVFTLVMFVGLGWLGWDSYQHVKAIDDQQFGMLELSGRIIYLDEVLTMSARMAAATGEAKWENRYRQFQPLLDDAIKEAKSSAPEAFMSEAAARTDAANIELVAMENKAFEMVREGNREAAANLLHSPEYQEQKRIYSDGMADFTDALRQNMIAEHSELSRKILITVILVSVTLSLILFAWVVTLRTLKHVSTQQEAEEKNRIILQTSMDGFWVVDPEGSILEVNDAYCRMAGYSREELLNMNIKDVEAAESPQEIAGRIRHITDIGSLRFESRHKRKDGTIIDVDVCANCLGLDGGRIFTFFRDITERKKAEQKLRRSEEKFRDIIENTAVGMYRTTPDGRILMANPALVRMLGYSSFEELAERNLEMEGYEPKYPRSEFKQRIEREGRVVAMESAWLRRDGTILSIIENARTIRDETGNILYYEGTAEDITERKRTEKALCESEERYRTLVESAGESIATIDYNGQFLFANTTMAKRLGIRPEDCIGKTMWELFPKKIADRQMKNIRRVINTAEGLNAIALTELQGQSRWYNTTIEPLRNGSGKVTAALVIARDIHEFKQAQDELARHREEMVRAEQLASLGTLSAMTAHKLTQPLTIIGLSLENALANLESTFCPDTVREALKDSLAEVSNVTSIINSFRNFARKSSEKNVREVNIKAVAERIVKLLGESARSAKVALELKKMEKLPCIYSNEKELEQLFFALVENAIQAADGKKIRRLTISGDIKDGRVVLQFSDNCGGIAPENLDKIFEPFFTTKTEWDKTGLGLCIVEQIATRAGGKVRVESQPGKGSTFFVTLPVKGNRRS